MTFIRPHRFLLAVFATVIPLLEYMLLFYYMNVACIFVVLVYIPVRFFVSFSLYKYFFRELLMNRFAAVGIVIAMIQIRFPILLAAAYAALDVEDYKSWSTVVSIDITLLIMLSIYRAIPLAILKYIKKPKTIKKAQLV